MRLSRRFYADFLRNFTVIACVRPLAFVFVAQLWIARPLVVLNVDILSKLSPIVVYNVRLMLTMHLVCVAVHSREKFNQQIRNSFKDFLYFFQHQHIDFSLKFNFRCATLLFFVRKKFLFFITIAFLPLSHGTF